MIDTNTVKIGRHQNCNVISLEFTTDDGCEYGVGYGITSPNHLQKVADKATGVHKEAAQIALRFRLSPEWKTSPRLMPL